MVSKTERVLELLQERGMARPRDLVAENISGQYLAVLQARGVIERVSRGLYRLPDARLSIHVSLAEVAQRIPHAVVCLLSALRFHGLTTQAPLEVWIAIAPKAHIPRAAGVALRVMRFSGPALSSGIEEHSVDGVTVRVYSPAKTVADCFKYRNKIGLDVALEALRDCWQQRRCTMDQLWEYGRICRVANVMRPYLESLI
jgi:predicted transcriptional regulator of viral defense system